VEVGSYGHQKRVKVLLRNCQLVLLKCKNIPLNRLPNIHDGLFTALALRNTTRKAWALGDPKSILTWINDDLSHG
jgi:hypothetical protein